MSGASDYFMLDRFVSRAERDESWKSKCGRVSESCFSPTPIGPALSFINGKPVHVFLLDDQRNPLSNSAHTPFSLNNTTFVSVEHFLSFKEASVVGDVRAIRKILRQPQHHAQFLKRVEKVEEYDVRRAEMIALVMHEKFRVYPDLMELLIATGQNEILAISNTDQRMGCNVAPDFSINGSNICGKLLTIIRARELMNRAMIIPVLTYPFIEEKENEPPNTYVKIQKILRNCENLTPRFFASFVPKLPFEIDSPLAPHLNCFQSHDSNLPVAVGANRFGSACCIQCDK